MGEGEGFEIGRITKIWGCGELSVLLSRPKAILGRGEGTISNAEVPFPPPPRRRSEAFAYRWPQPLYLLGWRHLGSLPREKRRRRPPFGGISVFSPSVCRTHAAGWGRGGRGCAGRRSSWRVPSFPHTQILSLTFYVGEAQTVQGKKGYASMRFCEYCRRKFTDCSLTRGALL